MKNKFIYPLIFFVLVISSCVQDDTYDIPQIADTFFINPAEQIIENIEAGVLEEIPIANISNFINANGPTEITGDYVVKGYVVSSDASGNFYQEFYMQDQPSNPTAGIKVAVALNDVSSLYNIGREVYISLKGLYVGEANNGDGIAVIGGKVDEDEVDAMTPNQVYDHVFRSDVVETIVPLELSLPTIDDTYIGRYIQIPDTQFVSDEVGQSLGDPTDYFDTHRTLEDCSNTVFLLEISSFANYKLSTIPGGNGTIEGVVSKDYNGDNLVLLLNDIAGIQMNDERCP